MEPGSSAQSGSDAQQAPGAGQFLEPGREWRRLFAEACGTFLLVVVAAGAGVVDAVSGGKLSPGMKVVAPGLMVMAILGCIDRELTRQFSNFRQRAEGCSGNDDEAASHDNIKKSRAA